MSDKAFKQAVLKHAEKVEAERLSKLAREQEAAEFNHKLAQFPSVIFAMAKKSRQFKQYLKEGATREKVFEFDPQMARALRRAYRKEARQCIREAKEKGLPLPQTAPAVRKKRDPDRDYVVRINLATVTRKEDGWNEFTTRNTSYDVPYYIQLVKGLWGESEWRLGIYKWTERHGEKKLSEAYSSPEVYAVMKRLLDPETLLETLFEHRSPLVAKPEAKQEGKKP